MSAATTTRETPQQAASRLLAGKIREGFAPLALHVYTDTDGEPLFWRARLKHPATVEKVIRPIRWNGERFELGEPPAPAAGRPLYRLHELAARPGESVIVAEGEGCADALAALGLLATTSGGADSAGRANWQPLTRRDVLIWPDNDEAGARYGLDVAERLCALNCTVRLVDVSALGLPPKADCVDWLERHDSVTGADVLALATVEPPGTTADDDWPEPAPLPQGLPPVRGFDMALLPDSLRPWVGDIVERVQCAPEFVAVAAMAGLGAVIGRKLGIRPQARTDWTVTPNQWALIVGRPGVLKSPAIEATLAPIKRLAAQALETYEAAAKWHAIEAKAAKLRAEEGEKAARALLKKTPGADVSAYLATDEPPAPMLRRYIAIDSNAASLGELHRQNPNGLLVHRDELVSLLRSLDREDQAEARGFYLTGWNGDSAYTFDRIGRGLNLHISAVCLSMLGSTQPGRIAEYVRHAVRGGAGDDGLMQRFGLLVWPDSGGEWRNVDRWPDSDAKRTAYKVFEHLDRLEPDAVGAQRDEGIDGEPDGLPYLRFDADARGLFLEWRTDLEARLRSGDLHPAMESHLAKYRKLVPGLALILHLAGGGTGPVSHAATLQALAWSELLESHAARAYASVSAPDVAAAKAILARIRKGDLPATFAGWQVWRPGWALLSDRQQVNDALALLVDLGWLAASRTDTGGRPATAYTVNPRGLSA